MKVLCIGSSAYDITTPVDQFPTENVKYLVDEQIECGGGSCGNAAYLLAKWGIETYYVGMVGDDFYGKRIRDEFRVIGVNTDYLVLKPNYSTRTSHIIVNKSNGSRTIIGYHPQIEELDDIDINVKPDLILLDGREYKTAKKVLEANKDVISVIDAGSDRKDILDLCKLCTYVVCSKEFMERVSGLKLDNHDNLNKAFDILYGMFNTNIIVTLESDGCAYKEGNEVKIIPTLKVKAVDTTGAGDIFHGAFAYGLLQKWDLEKCLRFANLAGSLSVTKYGGRNSIFELKEMEKMFDEIK